MFKKLFEKAKVFFVKSQEKVDQIQLDLTDENLFHQISDAEGIEFFQIKNSQKVDYISKHKLTQNKFINISENNYNFEKPNPIENFHYNNFDESGLAEYAFLMDLDQKIPTSSTVNPNLPLPTLIDSNKSEISNDDCGLADYAFLIKDINQKTPISTPSQPMAKMVVPKGILKKSSNY